MLSSIVIIFTNCAHANTCRLYAAAALDALCASFAVLQHNMGIAIVKINAHNIIGFEQVAFICSTQRAIVASVCWANFSIFTLFAKRCIQFQSCIWVHCLCFGHIVCPMCDSVLYPSMCGGARSEESERRNFCVPFFVHTVHEQIRPNRLLSHCCQTFYPYLLNS